jgi:hypothetical protein
MTNLIICLGYEIFTALLIPKVEFWVVKDVGGTSLRNIGIEPE